MKPYEKVRFLAGHFDRFIEYNPEYVQEGPIQIVVSATKDVGAYQIGPDEYGRRAGFPERLCAGQNILWPCSAKPETVQVLTDVSSVVCMQIHFICILTAKGLFILTGCWTTTTGFCRPR